MQFNYYSATLTGRAIALPPPGPSLTAPRLLTLLDRRGKSAHTLLYEAGKDSWESVVWIALGICSLAVMIISLI